MAKVLISLVSQQRVPNVLAIMDPFFADVNEYLFISTQDMESLGVVEHIQVATALSEQCCDRLIVDPNDWSDVVEKLELAIQDGQNEYHLNLTGGTKIMALAAFSFFQGAPWQVHYYYLPISNNVIHRVGNAAENRAIPVTYEMGLMAYLQSYGLAVAAADFSAPLKPIDVSTKILAYHTGQAESRGKSHFWSGIAPIKPLRGKGRSYKIDQHPKLRQVIHDLEMPLLDEQIMLPQEIQYLTGGWFEEWVFQEVKVALKLSERMIARNLNIYWLGEETEFGNNELDVVFMYKNTIHIIECKSGLGNRTKVKEQFTRALNQLAAFRRKMGLRVEMAFVTLSQHLRDDDGELAEHYSVRANVLSIQVLDGQDIVKKFRQYLMDLQTSL